MRRTFQTLVREECAREEEKGGVRLWFEATSEDKPSTCLCAEYDSSDDEYPLWIPMGQIVPERPANRPRRHPCSMKRLGSSVDWHSEISGRTRSGSLD